MKKPPPDWPARLRQLLERDLWLMEPKALPWFKSMALRFARIMVLITKGCLHDELPLRASALTYISLMSIIPLLAIFVAFSRAVGYGDAMLQYFVDMQDQLPDQLHGFLSQVEELVRSTSFAGLGWTGGLIVLSTATMVMAGMEKTFNRIWGVERSRSFPRRFANYISLLVVVPILAVMAVTLSASLRSDVVLERLGSMAGVYLFLLQLGPTVSLLAAFALLYSLLPNMRVRFVPALCGGLVAGLAWLLWQRLYIQLQFGVVKYNAIYGTFASVPIFLAWLYVGWIILLVGAEVAFAVQNVNTFRMEREASHASSRVRQDVALRVLAEVGRRFRAGEGEFHGDAFAAESQIPSRLMQDVLKLLCDRKLLAPLHENADGYALLRAPETIPLREVLDGVIDDGASMEDLGLRQMPASWQRLLSDEKKAREERTLADLLVGDS